MARDVGGFAEAKRVQESMEKRESGYSESGPGPSSMNWKETFKGGKTQPTKSSFTKPSMGKVRSHLE